VQKLDLEIFQPTMEMKLGKFGRLHVYIGLRGQPVSLINLSGLRLRWVEREAILAVKGNGLAAGSYGLISCDVVAVPCAVLW
jgi:hypothetical protein